MVVIIHKSFFYLCILSKSIEFRPNKMFLDNAILLMQCISLRREFLEEILLFMGIKKRHDCIQRCKYDNIQALVKQLLLIIGLCHSNSGCEDGSPWMHYTYQWEYVEYLEIFDLV